MRGADHPNHRSQPRRNVPPRGHAAHSPSLSPTNPLPRPRVVSPPMADELLVRFLAAHDAPCPVCRYNLRGLTVDACPECSAPLRLEIASPNLHIGPFVLAIVSFSLGAGFDLVVALIFSVMALIFAQPAAAASWIGPVVMIGTLGSLGTLCILGIVLLVKRRPAWNRLGTRRQWRAAIATFIGVGAVHAAVGAMLVALMS